MRLATRVSARLRERVLRLLDASPGVGKSVVRLAVLTIAVIAAVWLLTLERIGYEEETTSARAVTESSNLAIAYEEHTSRTLRGIDRELEHLANDYLKHPAGSSLTSIFDDGVFTFIGVANDRGDIVLSSLPAAGVNVGDREYFRVHRAGASVDAYIGAPILGRVAGKWAITMSRRISRGDGSFAGVAFASVDPAYFTRFYEKADLGSDGLVVLAGLDGIVRARRAGVLSNFGQDIRGGQLLTRQVRKRSGNFVLDRPLDKAVRFVSYRTLEQYPLVVAVGFEQNEVRREFLARRRNYLAMAWLATVAVCALALAFFFGTARTHRAIKALRASEARSRAAFNQAAVGIVETSLDSALLDANPRFCSMLGYSREELLALRVGDITHPQDVSISDELAQRMLKSSDASYAELEKRYVRKDGSVVWAKISSVLVRDGRGHPEYFLVAAQDMTEPKALQDKLVYEAHHDRLTGLPNRVLCQERLQQAIERSRRAGGDAALFFIDLDRFKNVNDTLGHSAGDALLREVAVRIKRCLRAEDTVGRFGGDEFAVVLGHVERSADCGMIARKIIDALSGAFVIGGHELYVSASIGITTIPDDGMSAEALLINADTAMFRAKELGGGTYLFYTAAMNTHSLQKLLMENDLKRALRNDEFVLHYQPKVELASGEIAGCEALLRWNHAQRGLRPPGEFIPLLETSGEIVAIGEWVLRAACRQIARWRDRGIDPVPIAVNLSAKQFSHDGLCEVVRSALAADRVEGRYLELEITESAAMRHADNTIRTLHELRSLGVRVSIDDFGTGYSSLCYLKRFPLDALKLDRSFVSGLPANQDDASITRAVITMAHSLNLKVVAEGVETAAQRAFLRFNRCDEIQGYLVAKPLPGDDMTALLSRRREPPGDARIAAPASAPRRRLETA